LRKVVMLAALIMVITAVVATAAFAATRTGNQNANTLNGTNADDIIYGLGGNDDIDGRGGDDNLYGGEGRDDIQGGTGEDYIVGDKGRDTVFAGGANDFVDTADEQFDFVNCGGGDDDTAVVDVEDNVSNNCENVFEVD
jgi:Ca2+-binding RTX toxin-like protein